MQPWDRSTWETLISSEKKERLTELLPLLPVPFENLHMQIFEQFGRRLETGVVSYEGREFVFVPGESVEVGWEYPKEKNSDKTDILSRLEKSLQEDLLFSPQEAKIELQQHMSPVRQIQRLPMFIEREPFSVGWIPYEIEDLHPEDDKDLIDEIEKFSQSTDQSLEVDQSFKLERNDDGIRLFIFDDSETFEEWQSIHMEEGFSLLNEEEWESVYSAGADALFPWGNDIEHFLPQRPPIIQNGLGLIFSVDPYLKELTSTAEEFTGKGGDGGAYLHGGFAKELAYLSTATAFRDREEHELDWCEWIGAFLYRRVVRIPV